MMVFIAIEKLHVSVYSCHIQVLTNPTLPNIGTYKIPHLLSQFPPYPTPTQPESSTPSYIQIH